MDTTASDLGRMESKLQQWGAQLDQMLAKAKEASAEVTVERRARLDDLKSKHDAARARLAELKASGSENWDAFKAGAEVAWRDLEAAFDKLLH